MKKVARIVGLAALVAVAACDGGDPGPMSGHQALPGRDFGGLFFWKSRTLTFTRDTADPSQPEPQDLFVWPLDEPAPSLALGGIDWQYPSRWPAWLVGDLLLTGSQYERVYDVGNRQSADLFRDFDASPAVDPSAPGATPPQLYELLEATAMRSDGRAVAKLISGSADTGDTIVVGRPPELHAFKVAAGTTVGAITFLGSDLALLVRQKTADSDVVGVQKMSASTGAMTELIAPTPASEWVGVAGFCSDSQSPGTCGFFATVGCTIDEPACDDGHAPPCLILFGKVAPDDATKKAAFVHDVAAGTTAKLDGADPDRF
jgi:hypothetical protein